MLYLHIFKNYCHIRNRKPHNVLLTEFREKTKLCQGGPKNALFWSFWA